jgi:hypothetical protein
MAIATGLILALGVTPANAAAQHDIFVEEFDDGWQLSADENPCGPWVADIHEVRLGTYRLLLPPGGQVAGEVHVNGSVDGWIDFDPDGPGPLPTHSGSYREKLNAIPIGFSEETGDMLRIAQYRLKVRLSAADGSQLLLELSGKITMNARGDVVVARDLASCS